MVDSYIFIAERRPPVKSNLKTLFSLLMATLLILACGLSAPSTTAPSDQVSVETLVASTMQALTAAAPPPTETIPGQAVAFQNVSFIVPTGLGSGATSELVPAADGITAGPWGTAPQHIVFKLTGYPAVNSSLEAVVQVYPAQEYSSVNPWAETSLSKLKAVLASPSQPLTNDNLSTVPFNGAAAQQYAAQAKLLTFNGGSGVRMISQYAQFPGPITRDGSFYHYEGLTADGKYMVAILFPLTLPLTATADNPSADGIQYPDLNTATGDDLVKYYQAITDRLNAAAPDSFQPSLTLLDQLVQSITVTPGQTSVPSSSNGVTFQIPTGLASDAAVSTTTDVELPYTNPSAGDMPLHTVFHLNNYIVPGQHRVQPEILVFRAAEYAQYTDLTAQTIAALQTYTPGQPLPESLKDGVYQGQIQPLQFQNGKGIRYLVQFDQSPMPANNQAIYYYFHGLTNDRQFYVQVFLPIHVSFLVEDDQPTSITPADGVQFDWTNLDGFPAYAEAINQKLNATGPDSFSPSLATLDALIQSIMVVAP